MMQSTSPAWLSRPCSAVITRGPRPEAAAMTLLKHEPSAHSPWAKTMLGLCCSDMASSFLFEPVNSGQIVTPNVSLLLSHPTESRRHRHVSRVTVPCSSRSAASAAVTAWLYRVVRA